MSIVYPVKEIKSIEAQWAAENGGATWPLMIKAATSFVRQYLQELKGAPVLILAGNGNNGGDGYYIGKLLIEAGVKVRLYAPFGLPPETIDAAKALKEYLASGGAFIDAQPFEVRGCIIDALFGIGLNRELNSKAIEMIQFFNSQQVPIYCVDIPSGLNAHTGKAMPVAINAAATHAFIGLKPGLLTHSGPASCGQLTLDTLAVSSYSDWRYSPDLNGLPVREGHTHKAQQGNVRVVGGHEHMAGAAIISATAALNCGAGRVFLHCNEAFFPAAIVHAPEIMTSNQIPNPKPDSQDVYVLGPGLGSSTDARLIYDQLIALGRGVLDAAGLRLLAEHPQPVPNWVLTPHEGEAAALLALTSDEVASDRVKAVIALAQKYQTTVVLKGAGTLVSNGQQLVFCHPGSPAMATPGMGDCLAGIIGSLLALHLDLADAAVMGVNWHASIGAKLAQTQRIVLASDVIRELKRTV